MARWDDRRDDVGGVRPGYWFAPKAFGFGARPVTWQGWATLLGYAVLLMAVIHWFPGALAKIVIGFVLTFAFGWLSWVKTDGGWHWHWRWPR